VRVLLVATNRMTTPFPVYPLGVDHVATALRQRHDVRVIDRGMSGSDGDLIGALADFHPEIVGLSIRNIDDTDAETSLSFVPEIEQLVAVVRANSGAKVVLGGPGYSLFPAELLERTGADWGVLGEGEWVAGLIDAIQNGAGTEGLPGIVHRGHPAPEPAIWPGPWAREIGPKPIVAHYLCHGGILNIQTKRGCPFRCSYCTYPLIEGRELRAFDPDRVADEWVNLVDAGAKFIFVTDAVFNSDVRHNLDVAGALSRRNVRVPWGAFFTPIRPAPGYYEALCEVGLTHVEFGTDSLSPQMLSSYAKPFTPDDAVQAHAAARGAGAYVAHYLTLGGSGETLETAKETLDRCEALEGVSALFFFCGVRIYPATPLFDAACRQGQASPSESLLEPRFYHSPGAPPDALRELVKEQAKGRASWIVGSTDEAMARIIKRMHARGAVGPLWERIIP